MPTPRPDELAVLEVVALQLTNQGKQLGNWEYEPNPPTVDFVYEDAQPEPLAIELTMLVEPKEAAGFKAMMKHLADPLNEMAEREEWGSWHLSVASPGYYKDLAPVVVELIQQGFEVKPDGYSSERLRQEEERGTLDEFLTTYRAAKEAGILFLFRSPGRGNSVSVGSMTTTNVITGFSAALQQTVFGKAKQLRQARPRQTHLVIDVVQWDFSGDVAETGPPSLPASIDRVWVLHRWAHRPELPNLWWVDRSGNRWATATVEPPRD